MVKKREERTDKDVTRGALGFQDFRQPPPNHSALLWRIAGSAPTGLARLPSLCRRPATRGLISSDSNAALIGGNQPSAARYGEDEAAAAAGAQRAAVGTAVAVGEDGLLHRGDVGVAAARVRAAAVGRAAGPPPPARAALQLPPRPATRPTSRLPPRRLLRRRARRPGQDVPLRLLARRPPRGLRRALPPHPLRLHRRRRRRRGLQVGRRRVQRRLPLLRPRQGRRGLRRRWCRARVAGEGSACCRRGHVPHVARARRRTPRHGLPRVLPRATTPARLQNRRRSGKTKGRPNAQGTEAMHGMTV